MDESAVQLALRARVYGMVIKTTGPTDLAQTVNGFTRSAGSFITDGFRIGMEVTPVGFPANVIGIVYSVEAQTVKVTGLRAVVAEGPARQLDVGLPSMQNWEGIPITPTPGKHYITEEFSPSTSKSRGLTASGAMMEDTGDYFLTWYMPTAVENVPGVASKTLRDLVTAMKRKYPAGLGLVLGSAPNVINLYVRTKPAPATAQIVPLNGWLALQLKVPWMALWTNGVTV